MYTLLKPRGSLLFFPPVSTILTSLQAISPYSSFTSATQNYFKFLKIFLFHAIMLVSMPAQTICNHSPTLFILLTLPSPEYSLTEWPFACVFYHSFEVTPLCESFRDILWNTGQAVYFNFFSLIIWEGMI